MCDAQASAAKRPEGDGPDSGDRGLESQAAAIPTAFLERLDWLRDRLAVGLFTVGAALALVPFAFWNLTTSTGPVVSEQSLWLAVTPGVLGGALFACHLWVRGDQRPFAFSYRGFSWIDFIALPLLYLCFRGPGFAVLAERVPLAGVLLGVGAGLVATSIWLLPQRRGSGGARRGRWWRAGVNAALVLPLAVGTWVAGANLVWERALADEAVVLGDGLEFRVTSYPGGTWRTEYEANSGHGLGYLSSPRWVATAYGPAGVSAHRYKKELTGTAATLALLNAADGTVRWRAGIPGGEVDEFALQEEPSYGDGLAAVDPEGRLLAVKLPASYWAGQDEEAVVVVFDADTGAVVRRVRVRGEVLHIALTADTLGVQVRTGAAPGARLLVFDFLARDAGDEPILELAEAGWLVGSTRDALLLGERVGREGGTVTQVDPRTGEELVTIDQVTKVHPGGWVERLTPAPEENYGSDESRELLNVDTGSRVDISGMDTSLLLGPEGYVVGLYSAVERNERVKDPAMLGAIKLDEETPAITSAVPYLTQGPDDIQLVEKP